MINRSKLFTDHREANKSHCSLERKIESKQKYLVKNHIRKTYVYFCNEAATAATAADF